MHELSHTVWTVAGIVAFLMVAAATLALTKRIRLPFTVALVVVGMVLTEGIDHLPQLTPLTAAMDLSPDLILFVFLPTLIFESAYNLDIRDLRRNLGPILLLAVPGLLLSTLLIAAILSAATSIPFSQSLVLGAILSATDPVAVVGLFRKLGAPARLTVLVEGESLLNDATAIVLARVLAGILAGGVLTWNTLFAGVLEFAFVFVGGALCGAILGVVFGLLLGRIDSDQYLEITLTTVLAYLSFLVAETMLHVSGVMATVAAGLVLGGWGRMKVSPDLRHYMEHFWEYMAFVANALIFLLVGMQIHIAELLEHLDVLMWVIAAMLVARAAVCFGLIPVFERLSGGQAVEARYRTVIFWGGLRGAIAIAIVLSLPPFENAELFVTLVLGAVLFTLLVQGLSMEALVRGLKLDVPPMSHRFAAAEALVDAKQSALGRIPELEQGGLFSATIGRRLREDYAAAVSATREDRDRLRSAEIDPDTETSLLMIRELAQAKALYIELSNGGHLSEPAFRRLEAQVNDALDCERHGTSPSHREARPNARRIGDELLRRLSRLPLLQALAERWRRERLTVRYEANWARLRGATLVLQDLDALERAGHFSAPALAAVAPRFAAWQRESLRQLDEVAEQLPEFVQAVQEQLGRRLLLLSESATLERQQQHGALPGAVARELRERLHGEFARLRARGIVPLRIDPESLLRQLPFFAVLQESELRELLHHVRERTFDAGETVFRQGDSGDSLFMIARGVLRVSLKSDSGERDIATLIAGDFFGEMALLHGRPRTTTIRTTTVAILYEIRRVDCVPLFETHPELLRLLEATDARRRQELEA